jgi:hypothetical protein
MIDFILLAFVNIFMIIGIFEASKKGKILYFFAQFCDKHLPTFLSSPLIGCVVCMASVYGTILFYLHFGSLGVWLLIYVPFVSGLVGFMYEVLLLIRKNRM